MLALFIASENGEEISGVVEGDDGLFYSKRALTSVQFARCGFEIKILEHHDLLCTGFCGMNMSEDYVSLTDPRKTILNFGWTHSPLMNGGLKVRMGLLRAKAMSLLYEHPRCPVLAAMAKRYITLTEGYNVRWESSWYERRLVKEVVTYIDRTHGEWEKGPSELSRSAFEHLYGISISQQKELEEYFSTVPLDNFSHPLIVSLFDGSEFDDCRTYWDKFVRVSPLDFNWGGFKAVLLAVLLALLLLMSWESALFHKPGPGGCMGGNPGPKRVCVLNKMPRDCTAPYAHVMYSPVARLYPLHGCRSANSLTIMLPTANKSEKIFEDLVGSRTLSPDGKDWLVSALDPFHDFDHPLAGYPDADCSSTVVSCYQYAMDISKPATVATSTWDAHIFTLPVISNTGAGRPYMSCTVDNAGVDITFENPNTDRDLGYLNVVFNDAGGKLFPTSTADMALATLTTSVLPLSTSAFNGTSTRVIAAGFEIVDTTADIYKQGACTVYRMPQNPISHPAVINDQAAATGKLAASVGTLMYAPPATVAEAMLLPNSRQWDAKRGAYVVCTQNSVTNPLGRMASAQPIVSNVKGVSYFALAQQGTTLSASVSPSITYYLSEQTKIIPFNTAGVMLTGLNAASTFRIKLKMYVETAPSFQFADTVVLATPSAPYDPSSLEAYSKALSRLPVGAMVSANAMGDWFRSIANIVSSVALPISRTLAGAGVPFAGAVTDFLENIGRADTSGKQNDLLGQDVVKDPAVPINLPQASRFAKNSATRIVVVPQRLRKIKRLPKVRK